MAIWNSPAFGLIGIGFFMATSIVGLTLLGRWIDGSRDSEPLWTLVFLVLGLTVGFYGAFTQLREVLRHAQRQNRRERGPTKPADRQAPRDGKGRR